MKRGAYICVAVQPVHKSNEVRQYIVAGKAVYPEILNTGKQKENYQSRTPRHHDVPHQLFECRYVEQQRIHMDADQVDKPEKVGNRKEFTKGNDVVQRAIHLKVSIRSPYCLQQEKQDSINRPVSQQF